ncbi:DUF829 domain-containing protein [archaeon]|nr:MAG: DUF829 domain-containing protein [archaeon]
MPAHKVTHEAASGGGSSGRALHAHAHTPSTRCGRFILTTKEDAVAAPDSPVLVIFGWVNARDVHVAQYAQLYHALGAAYVLRTTAPTSDVFLKPAGLRDLARHTLDTLQVRHAQACVRGGARAEYACPRALCGGALCRPSSEGGPP